MNAPLPSASASASAYGAASPAESVCIFGPFADFRIASKAACSVTDGEPFAVSARSPDNPVGEISGQLESLGYFRMNMNASIIRRKHRLSGCARSRAAGSGAVAQVCPQRQERRMRIIVASVAGRLHTRVWAGSHKRMPHAPLSIVQKTGHVWLHRFTQTSACFRPGLVRPTGPAEPVPAQGFIAFMRLH